MLIASSRSLLTGIFAFLIMVGSLPAQALVISQVYGGGGNSGATYKNDFIEIFNDSAFAEDLGGYSVQYASAAGSTWQLTTLSGLLEAFHYYLIEEAAGSGGTMDLPTPDATGSIALSAINGKVALVNDISALSGTCPNSLTIVDLIGYGSANCFEGTAAAPTLSNPVAALRLLGGLTDSGDNANDFETGAPNPRNSEINAIEEPSSLLLILAGGLMYLFWLKTSIYTKSGVSRRQSRSFNRLSRMLSSKVPSAYL